LKADPIWEKKKDRFGREMYYNKETKQSHPEKPEHWWTEEEKEAKRLALEKKLKEDEEAKKKAAEALERRLQPKVKGIIGELVKSAEAQKDESVKKLKEAKEPALPLPGLIVKGSDENLAPLYKQGTFNLDEVYHSRRVPLPSFLTHTDSKDSILDPSDPRYVEQFCSTLFLLSLHLHGTDKDHINDRRQWDTKILHIIGLYVLDRFFLMDNLLTIPVNPMDALFEVRYYKQGNVYEDLAECGYSDRRVLLEPYQIEVEQKQKLIEEEDSKKNPICSDEQWNTFWSHKAKLKKEMYRVIKLRALYGEGYEGYYDEEIVEKGEEEEIEEEES